MNTGGISATIIGLSTTFSPWLILAIFAITLVAQFGFFIPYLLESLWLFSGYSAITGIFSPYFLLVLCVTGILGRELGSGLFFYISSMGGSPLQRFYRRHIGPKLAAAAARKAGQAKLSLGTHILARIYSFSGDAGAGQEVQLFGKPLRLSPFNVALAHFLWMRVPVIITLGLKGKMNSLLLGVALFSVISDGIYIMTGIVGGAEHVNRTMMLLYPLGVMALIFATGYGVRRVGLQSARRRA